MDLSTSFQAMLGLVGEVPKTAAVAIESHSNPNEIDSIRTAFIKAVDGVSPTISMCKRVINYSKDLASRDEHISFFGGNLLGVDRIRMFDTDRDRWFDEVLQIDEAYLQECIHSVKSVNKDWKVAGDAFNLSVVWFVHKAMSELPNSDRTVQEAIVEALVVLQFRFLSSIYTHYFDKPVDNEAAEATYSALTMKFAIKRLGSWGAVLHERAEAFVSKDSKHIRDFRKFDDDEGIMYIVTDMSTRIRKSIKDQYRVLERIRSGNLRIETTSNTLVLDGDKIIRDQVNSFSTAKYYLLDVAGNESSFIKYELVDVVLDVMSTTSKQALVDILRAIASTPVGKKRDEVELFMEDTLMHAFDYIAKNRIRFNDIGFILNKMRALYMSSKSTDPRLLSLRDRIEKYAKRNSQLRASSALASVRTALMLYFLLRALSSNVYS